ncbi:MAG: tyrosine-type recombinase/integrase [Desulfovibrio sp.]|jgi:integrase|nr:tyrosine-type recombinase/integrase [Desulfovibrio sp.]
MATWITTQYSGVLYREHPARKHGPRPDRYYVIRYRAADGTRKTESLGWLSKGWTAEKAHQLICSLLANIKLGTGPQTLAARRKEAAELRETAEKKQTQRGTTFQDVAGIYMNWAKINIKSWQDIQARLNNHILPEIGNMPLVEITTQDIITVKNKIASKSPVRRENKQMSAASIMHCLHIIRAIFNYASGNSLFTGTNPARVSKKGYGIRPPKHDNRRLRILTQDECKMLMQYAEKKSRDLHDITLLSLDSGLRMSELLSLTWQCLSKDDKTLRIIGAVPGTTETKSGRTRIVTLGLLYPQSIDMLCNRKLASISAFIFPGIGKKQAYRDITSYARWFKRACITLGINKDITDERLIAVPHTMRHTFATRLLESGIDIYALKEILGHADLTTTERYIHLCDNSKRNLALAHRTIMNSRDL